MPKLYQNKFKINSSRLNRWNYADEGYYFITICTKNKINYFGQIINHKMHLSKIGEIAKEEWLKTKQIRKNIGLDEFVIMPNHIHGIIIINNNHANIETPRRGVSMVPFNKSLPDSRRGVSTANYNRFKHPQWQSNSIGAIVCQYKSICTKRIKKFEPNFTWQTRYYDHIIRNEESLYHIREYIFYNCLKHNNRKTL